MQPVVRPDEVPEGGWWDEAGWQSFLESWSREALALLVVAEPGVELNWEQMRPRLPAHWSFGPVRFVKELPKTANGKLARSALAQP